VYREAHAETHITNLRRHHERQSVSPVNDRAAWLRVIQPLAIYIVTVKPVRVGHIGRWVARVVVHRRVEGTVEECRQQICEIEGVSAVNAIAVDTVDRVDLARSQGHRGAGVLTSNEPTGVLPAEEIASA